MNSLLYHIAEIFMNCRDDNFWKYFNDRRISYDIVDKFKIGFSPPWEVLISENKFLPGLRSTGFVIQRLGRNIQPYTNLFTFPYFFYNSQKEEEIVGFMFRAKEEDEEPRYRNLPTKSSLPFAPWRIIKPSYYGLADALDYDSVTLVEGPFDMFRCIQAGLPNPIALAGMEVSLDTLIPMIRGKTAYLFLDWDKGGRKKMLDISLNYMRNPNKFDCQMELVVGKYGEGKDPADMTEDQIKEIFDNNRCSPEDFVHRYISKSIDPTDSYQVFLANNLLSPK